MTRSAHVLLATLGLAAIASPASAQGLPDPSSIGQFAQLIRWSGVATSLLVIAGAWVVLRVMAGFVERASRRFSARRLTLQKLNTIARFVIYIGTAIVALGLSLRLDDTVLAVIGGAVAVSVGFAIKDLIASFIAGVIIMLDRPFQVGDRVSFGGEYGDIIAIGLRSVRLQTLDDNTVTIPNNKFLTDMTSCGNYGALDMQVVMDFYIGADQDAARAQELVREAGLTSRFVHLPKPVVVLVNQVIQDSYVAVRLRLKAYVFDTRHEKAFETDVNLRTLTTLREAGIGPPAVLHRQLHSGAVPTGRKARATPVATKTRPGAK
ncbi:mechanosensitive ion channel [soil metagenome]